MEKLKFIKAQMAQIGIPYNLGEWSSDVKYPYYVGEVTEEPITTEDGLIKLYIQRELERLKSIYIETPSQKGNSL